MTRLLILFIPLPAWIIAQDYWQQEVNSVITVKLDDDNHTLDANIEIEYINNSPDELDRIFIHLWPNAYKNNQTALAKQFNNTNRAKFLFADEEDRGYITGLDFQINGQPVSAENYEGHIDVVKIELPEVLKPGASLKISTPFMVKFPGDFSRLGHTGQSYQVTQWFPKPAVYDHKGWHPMPYLDQGEFYSEFGSYKVTIDVPANYRVAATGVLQNESERMWLDSLSQLPKDDPSVGDDFPPSSSDRKSLTFIQDNVHDFAWFADKRYEVVKSQVTLASGKNVESWGFYLPDSEEAWSRSAMYIDSALYYYSKWVGEYPYDAATAVEGALSAGGGMEYPMITVISPGVENDFALDQVITHEVGHNWFYGILASNERAHAWMDEGFNTYVENKYIDQRYPEATLSTMLGSGPPLSLTEIGQFPYHYLGYYASVVLGSYGKQRPINTPSAEMNSINYGLNSYMHTGALLKMLESYLGEDLFLKCMHAYFNAYKFKHVYPEDVRQVFEKESGKNLDWFFDEAFNTTGQIDYRLARFDKGTSVTIKNKGTINAPVQLVTDDEVVWIEGFEGVRQIETQSTDFAAINDPQNSVDIQPGNNQKPGEKRIKVLTYLPKPGYRTMYWTPLIGFNEIDKFMIGGAVHNLEAIQKPFGYFFGPMYSFGENELNGMAYLKYDWLLKNNRLPKIRLSGQAQNFSVVTKYTGELNFFFLNQKPYKNTQRIDLSVNQIRSYYSFAPTVENGLTVAADLPGDPLVFRASYLNEFSKALSNGSFKANITYGYYDDQTRHEFFNIDVKGSYERLVSKNLAIQGMASFGYSPVTAPSSVYNYRTTGTADYLMNQYIANRNVLADPNLVSNQVINDVGTFRTIDQIADTWVATATIEVKHEKIPVAPYVTSGFVDGGDILYEAGFSIKTGLFDIYFPLAASSGPAPLEGSFRNWLGFTTFRVNISNQLLLAVEKIFD